MVVVESEGGHLGRTFPPWSRHTRLTLSSAFCSKEPSTRDPQVQAHPISRSAPASPTEEPSRLERSLYRHSSMTVIAVSASSSSSSPRSRFHPYSHGNATSVPDLPSQHIPHQHPHPRDGDPAKLQAPTIYDHPVLTLDADAPCDAWHNPSSTLTPSIPIEDTRYIPASFHSSTYPTTPSVMYQGQAYGHDADAQEQLLRSWEPILAETRLVMSGERPTPDVSHYDPYHGGPSMYFC